MRYAGERLRELLDRQPDRADRRRVEGDFRLEVEIELLARAGLPQRHVRGPQNHIVSSSHRPPPLNPSLHLATDLTVHSQPMKGLMNHIVPEQVPGLGADGVHQRYPRLRCAPLALAPLPLIFSYIII